MEDVVTNSPSILCHWKLECLTVTNSLFRGKKQTYVQHGVDRNKTSREGYELMTDKAAQNLSREQEKIL